MGFADWVISSTGAVVTLVAVAVIAWSLLADRFRTRSARRSGTLRRCPRCWYDMSSVHGLACPECGRVQRRERGLRRARCPWRMCVCSGLVATLGGGLLAWMHGDRTVWNGALPNWALVRLVPASTDGGALEELSKRLAVRGESGEPRCPGELSHSDWYRLTGACAEVMVSGSRRPDRELAQQFLQLSTPEPRPAIGSLLGVVSDATDDVSLAASSLLRGHVSALTDEELALVRNELKSRFPPDAETHDHIQNHVVYLLDVLRAEQVARLGGEHVDRIERARSVELTPEAICASLRQCNSRELEALCQRLGVVSGEWLHDDSLSRSLGLRRRGSGAVFKIVPEPMHLDDDSVIDSLVVASEPRGTQTLLLVFLRRGDGWRFAGMIPFRASIDEMTLRETEFEGRRFLRLTVEPDESIRPDPWGPTDFWYRVTQSRIDLLQCARLSFNDLTDRGMLFRTIESREPTLARARGRIVVRYDTAGIVDANIPDPTARRRILARVWSERGEFEFFLARGQRGYLDPGPWHGRDPEWLVRASPEEIFCDDQSRVRELFMRSDERLRIGLARYATTFSDSPDARELRDDLDP